MRTAASSIFSRRQQLRIICMWVAWNISLIASSTWLIFTIPKHCRSSFGQAPVQRLSAKDFMTRQPCDGNFNKPYSE